MNVQGQVLCHALLSNNMALYTINLS